MMHSLTWIMKMMVVGHLTTHLMLHLSLSHPLLLDCELTREDTVISNNLINLLLAHFLSISDFYAFYFNPAIYIFILWLCFLCVLTPLCRLRVVLCTNCFNVYWICHFTLLQYWRCVFSHRHCRISENSLLHFIVNPNLCYFYSMVSRFLEIFSHSRKSELHCFGGYY